MRYTIQKGDTLSALAKRFSTTVDALAKRNSIKNIDRIYAGASLDIPDAAEAADASPSGAPRYGWNGASEGAAAVAAPPSIDLKPYKSAYADKLDALLRSIDDREAFSYDYSDDPLYQGYKDSYTQGGRLAMLDTLGGAAALTGGYGSSYGQSAGQQTYQDYMTALSGQVPALEARAYDKYKQEGDALLERLEAYAALDASDYARYRDEVEDAYSQRDYAYARYRDERDDELKRYLAALDMQQQQSELEYKREKDASASSGKASSGADGSQKSSSSSGSSEGDRIRALFTTMTSREAKAMLTDAPSVSYIRSVLGADGLEELKRLYGAKD